MAISAILFTIFSELLVTAYFRFLADYDNMNAGSSVIFGSNHSLYWGILLVTILVYLISSLIQFYSVCCCLLNSSTIAHDKMI